MPSCQKQVVKKAKTLVKYSGPIHNIAQSVVHIASKPSRYLANALVHAVNAISKMLSSALGLTCGVFQANRKLSANHCAESDPVFNEENNPETNPSSPDLKPVILSHFEKLPFDILAFGVMSCLDMSNICSLRSCSKYMFDVADKFNSIRVKQELSNYRRQGNPLLLSQGGPQYVPKTGDGHSNALLYCFFSVFRPLLQQQKLLVDPSYMSRLQGPGVRGPGEYIEPGMRACLADWLLEVCVEYCFPMSVWHDTVLRVDVYLSKHTAKRSKLQLLGCICLMIEVSRLGNTAMTRQITTIDVVGLCEDQYSLAEVEYAAEIVVMDTSLALPLSEGWRDGNMTTIEYALIFLLNVRPVPTAHIVHRAISHADSFYTVGDNPDENLIFVLLLSELSVLDYELLRYSPFVIAAACVFYANLMMHHYSKSNVMIGPYGHVITCSSRELSGLG